MDEELKQLLIETLRQLREGASPAFQELVAQRSAYYGTLSTFGIIGGLLFAAVAAVLWTAIARSKKDLDETSWGIPACVCAIGSTMATIALCGQSVGWAAISAAPLGQILDVLGRG